MNLLTSDQFDADDAAALNAALEATGKRVTDAGFRVGLFQFRFQPTTTGKGVIQARPARALNRIDQKAWDRLTAPNTSTPQPDQT